RLVDVIHGEHDAQVAESVHRGAAVIGDHRRREKSGDLEPAMTVRRTHHGNLDAHAAQSSDAICPVSFDWGAPLELEAKFGEELNRGVNVFYHDADVVHTLDRHDAPPRLTCCSAAPATSLTGNAPLSHSVGWNNLLCL